MSAQYASPADWAYAADVLAERQRASLACAEDGGQLAECHRANADALRRVLASIATRGDARFVAPQPAPSRFTGRHGDMARLMVGDQ
jgi:phage terminase large subunit-like protein